MLLLILVIIYKALVPQSPLKRAEKRDILQLAQTLKSTNIVRTGRSTPSIAKTLPYVGKTNRISKRAKMG